MTVSVTLKFSIEGEKKDINKPTINKPPEPR
jgi:hypothetical protein